MSDRELLQQALKALELVRYCVEGEKYRTAGCYGKNFVQERADRIRGAFDAHKEAADALRARLTQPEDKPVATIRTWLKNGDHHAELEDWEDGLWALPEGEHKVYAAPQPTVPAGVGADAYFYEAGFRAGQRAAVPEGWKLVPEIPTDAMRKAGAEAVDDQVRWADAGECYAAMLDAAPQPGESE